MMLLSRKKQFIVFLLVVLFSVNQGFCLAEDELINGASQIAKPVFYELIQDNLKPEPNEFYLSMLFGNQDRPLALIKRSTNSRASEVYSESVAYTIGDNIADDYVIDFIDLKRKEVIVKKISTGEYYSLLLSYGNAVSRLFKKQNYKGN